MKKYLLFFIPLMPLLTQAQVTLIPDVKFEHILIAEGVDSDGIVNGQILTSDAQNATHLDLYTGIGSYTIQNTTGIEAFTNLESIEGDFHAFNTINLTNLTKLKSIILPSNCIGSIDLSSNTELQYLDIGNRELEFLQYNHMTYLDLSNNTKLEYLDVFSLDSLFKINLKNHQANKIKVILGWQSSPYISPNYNTVCIEVDDPVAATNKTFPYNNWDIINDNFVNYYFDSVCTLSVEKFVKENFKIYPNPTSDYVVIEQIDTENIQLQSVQIIDNTGKFIRSVKENFNYINVSDLASGTYLFVIQTNKGNKTEKIIIE